MTPWAEPHEPASECHVVTTWPISVLCYPFRYTEQGPSATSAVGSNSDRQTLCAVNPLDMDDTPGEDLTSVAFWHFVGSTLSRINRVPSKHNIKFVVLPPRKVTSYLCPVKNGLDLKTPDVCSTP